jgi:hypothetical protein
MKHKLNNDTDALSRYTENFETSAFDEKPIKYMIPHTKITDVDVSSKDRVGIIRQKTDWQYGLEEYIKHLEEVHESLDGYLWQLEHLSQKWQIMDFRTLQKSFFEEHEREDFDMTAEVYEDFRNHILEHRIKTVFKKIQEQNPKWQKTLIFDVRDHEYNVAKFYDFLMACVDDYDNIKSMEITSNGHSVITMYNTRSEIRIVNWNKLQDTDMIILSNMINKMPNLKSLSLPYNNINATTFEFLLSNLKISKLNVHFNDIHGFSQVTNQTVKELVLVDTNLTDTDAKVLSKMDLSNLNVRGNNITFEGFIDILKISRMKTLDISANDLDQNINDDNLKKLTDILNSSDDTEFQHLEQLELNRNNLGKYSADVIRILHQKYKNLKTVSFQGCDIDDETAVKIVESFLQLPKSDKKIYIEFSNNKITIEGYKEILELSKEYEDQNQQVVIDLRSNKVVNDRETVEKNESEWPKNWKIYV